MSRTCLSDGFLGGHWLWKSSRFKALGRVMWGHNSSGWPATPWPGGQLDYFWCTVLTCRCEKKIFLLHFFQFCFVFRSPEKPPHANVKASLCKRFCIKHTIPVVTEMFLMLSLLWFCRRTTKQQPRKREAAWRSPFWCPSTLDAVGQSENVYIEVVKPHFTENHIL